MSIKLHLGTGDHVRNINPRSCRKGWVGHVIKHSQGGQYLVRYINGEEQIYYKNTAHLYLEKIEQPQHDARQVAKALTFAERYGIEMTPDLEKAWDEMVKMCGADARIVVTKLNAPKRRVLKKVRRNVITGKTQCDHVKSLGYAEGVAEFNTRALGRSTGQALRAIGSAMCNPGVEVEISGVDHFLESNNHGRVNRHQVDREFRSLVQHLVGDMRGFTFTPTHIVFNPIVTEEVYVE